MTKKSIFAAFALFCAAVAFTVSACSSDEEPNAQTVVDDPLAQAIVQAMEQSASSATEQYIVYSPTDGSQIVDEATFTLANMMRQAMSSPEETTFTFNPEEATVRNTRGVIQEPSLGKWIYAGRTSLAKVKAMKFALKLVSTLPPDKEIIVKVVPVYNDKKKVIAYDVYYQIV